MADRFRAGNDHPVNGSPRARVAALQPLSGLNASRSYPQSKIMSSGPGPRPGSSDLIFPFLREQG